MCVCVRGGCIRPCQEKAPSRFQTYPRTAHERLSGPPWWRSLAAEGSSLYAAPLKTELCSSSTLCVRPSLGRWAWPPGAQLMGLLSDDLSRPVLSQPPHRGGTHPLGSWLMPTLLAPRWVLPPPRLPGSTLGSSQVEPIHGGHQPILSLATSWSRLVTPGPCPQGGRPLYLRLPLASPSPPLTPTIPWALGLVCSGLSSLSWPSPLLRPARPPAAAGASPQCQRVLSPLRSP